MTSSASADPAAPVRGRGTLSGRRATSRTPVGGGIRTGTGRQVVGGPVLISAPGGHLAGTGAAAPHGAGAEVVGRGH